MKLSRVQYKNGRFYIERFRKGHYHSDGKWRKVSMMKIYGQITICKNCYRRTFVVDDQLKRGGKSGWFCSHKCKVSGVNNPNWADGVAFSDGYLYELKPNHKYCMKSGYVGQHRLVMEKHLGRYLAKEEIIHHRNEDTLDNRIENLELHTQRSHTKLHKLKK